MHNELPPASAKGYRHSVPLPHDIQMRAAGVQMVFGLSDPSKARGEKTIIDMLPKKVNPPPFAKKVKEPGWGLHAKMGFSQRRLLVWLLFCFVSNGIFVSLWLVYISKTDLQNAFVPTSVATFAMTLGLAVLQMPEGSGSR